MRPNSGNGDRLAIEPVAPGSASLTARAARGDGIGFPRYPISSIWLPGSSYCRFNMYIMVRRRPAVVLVGERIRRCGRSPARREAGKCSLEGVESAADRLETSAASQVPRHVETRIAGILRIEHSERRVRMTNFGVGLQVMPRRGAKSLLSVFTMRSVPKCSVAFRTSMSGQRRLMPFVGIAAALAQEVGVEIGPRPGRIGCRAEWRR